MTHLLQTTIAGSLPKPAWLAPPSQLWAPWLLEGEALAEGKRDAVRLVLRDQERAGIDIVTDGEQTRRHFVTDVHRAPRWRRFRARSDRAHPQSLRRRRPGGRRPGRAPAARCSSRTPASCATQTERPGQVHAARPDDHGGHALRRHYRSREKLAWAFAAILNEEARDHRGDRRRRHPVRRAGIQRLFRRGARLGHRGAGARRAGAPVHDRRAHLLRLRHQGQHRLEEDAGLRMAAVRGDVSAARGIDDRPGVARVRELARADRTASGCSRARTCWWAPSTSPARESRRPRRSRPRCARR